MHYVIGLITAIAGLIWALNSLQRAGVDLNAFNPFFWWRRHQIAKKYGANPLHVLDNPMEVAALLLLATVKCDGEISREEKQFLLNTFENEFRQSSHDASSLLSQATYLLRDESDVSDQLDKILKRSLPRFTQQQIESTLDLMQHASTIERGASESKRRLIAETARIFGASLEPAPKWQ